MPGSVLECRLGYRPHAIAEGLDCVSNGFLPGNIERHLYDLMPVLVIEVV